MRVSRKQSEHRRPGKGFRLGWTSQNYLFLTLPLALLVSCDCMQRLQGYAIDAETGLPLAEVFYSRSALLTTEEKGQAQGDTRHRYQRRTDNTGWFMDWRLVNGRTCKPHLILWLNKAGYEPLRLEWQPNKSSLDTLFIEMHKNEGY